MEIDIHFINQIVRNYTAAINVNTIYFNFSFARARKSTVKRIGEMARPFALLLFLLSFITNAQSNTNHTPLDMNHSNSKTKQQYITQANALIKTKHSEFTYNPEDYEITVWSNSEKTLVKYSRIIKFIPLSKKKDRLRYDFEVNLTTQNISPFDSWGMTNFYIPTAIEQEQIDFVITSFNKWSHFGFNNTITEETDMYRIDVNNDMAFGTYFLDKTTGKEAMGSIEGSYAPMPDIAGVSESADALVEIKE